MRIDRDSIEEIISTLTQNKSRSLLTAFGVFWGIFMLVSLMGGGNGLQDKMKANFEGFATNSCFIIPSSTGEAYKGFRKGRTWYMTDDDIDHVKKNVDGIDVVTPVSARWDVTAYRGVQKYECSVKGLMPDYEAIEHQSITMGRFINDIDIRDRRKVCVLGKNVYEALCKKGEDPCGSMIRADGVYYKIVGVVSSSSDIQINGSAADQIQIPFSVYQAVYNCGNKIQIMCLTVKEGYKVSALKDQIEGTIKAAHFISPTDQQAMWMLDADSMFSMMDNLFIGIKILILLVGSGTLLAGIIGVSNIMMVTVRERTVEIGIRRAIGARPADIMQQILAESVILTMIAGMAGICAGVGFLSILESRSLDDASRIFAFQLPFGTALAMLAVVIILGIVAGMAPAYRAMAIKPVDAMRDE